MKADPFEFRKHKLEEKLNIKNSIKIVIEIAAPRTISS